MRKLRSSFKTPVRHASVVALVFIALGRREAAIVGKAVILTLTVTFIRFMGLGLYAESCLAVRLGFSRLVSWSTRRDCGGREYSSSPPSFIPHKTLTEIIPGAVDEVVDQRYWRPNGDCRLVADVFCQWLDGPHGEPNSDQC